MFLHTYIPIAIAFNLGPLTVYWYGIIIALAMAAAIALACLLARYFGLKREVILDAAFWMIIGGLLGARIYEIFLELPYYIEYPDRMIQIWRGGLAIHGALIGGVLALLLFVKKYRLDFWKLAAVCAPAVAIGQAIGRWGNWFNQELFGRPTSLPWGIPIDIAHRPAGYEMFSYFHPTFLYESLGCLAICLLLVWMVKKKIAPVAVLGMYAVLYGLLRFGLEFIKIDATPVTWGLRWPQIISLVLIVIGAVLLMRRHPRGPVSEA